MLNPSNRSVIPQEDTREGSVSYQRIHILKVGEEDDRIEIVDSLSDYSDHSDQGGHSEGAATPQFLRGVA